MFKDNPLHDWTSHGADEFRYAAVVEGRMSNEDDDVNISWEMKDKDLNVY